MSLFGGAKPRNRLPSYGGIDPSDAYDAYSPYNKTAKRGGGGGSKWVVWGAVLLLATTFAALGWSLHTTRGKLRELQVQLDVLDEQLLYETVRMGS